MSEATLRARIARLERAARRDRAFALGAIAILLATAQAPAPPPAATPQAVVTDASGANARIGAFGLTVRDASGVLRVDASIDSGGYPSLDEYDAKGKLREAAYLIDGRPVFRQFDANGKRRGEIFLAADTENGEFVSRDASEATRVAAFIGDKGLPELGMYGSDGNVRAYLASDDAGPYLVMLDAAKQTRVTIGQYTDGAFGIDVRSSTGTTLFKKP